MSVLSDLEKQLGIQPVDLSWDNCFKNKCWLDGVNLAPSPIQKSQTSYLVAGEPYVPDSIDKEEKEIHKQARQAPNVGLVAQRLGTSAAVIANIYTQVCDIKNNSTDNYLRRLCTEVINGIKYNTISKQQCNALISEINSLTGRK